MDDIVKTSGYNLSAITEFENKWRKYWYRNNIFRSQTPKPGEKSFYCLDMFPYPSGAGLHVGHPVGYIASDIYCRYKRMHGFNVLHPMGWDAFGLPAERYAVKMHEHPSVVTKVNAENYKRQMQLIGLSYDWDREIYTTDPEYYKWTQYIFLKLYNAWFDEEQQKARPIEELPIPESVRLQGAKAVSDYKNTKRLVYYDYSEVNWCPALNTVVANEEVMADGRTEHGYEVVKKAMKQVKMRITAYADRLLQGLEKLDWSESIKEQQRVWIGKTKGVQIVFRGTNGGPDIEVFTTHIETIWGVSFLVIAPDLDIVKDIVTPEQKAEVDEYVKKTALASEKQRKMNTGEKTGAFTGYYVENPLTGDKVPVYVADYVLKDHGTGAVMGVASHDSRDFDFAVAKNLAIIPLFVPKDAEIAKKILAGEMAWEEEGKALPNTNPVYNELQLEGKGLKECAELVGNYVVEHKLGKFITCFKMRDWVFARQRYWGEPIPLINWEDGTTTSVAESELPLTLPVLPDNDYAPAGDGKSALAKATDWVQVTDPVTGMKGERELSTMPQWAGSCWYPLRYMDPKNSDYLVDPAVEDAWGSVDLYIGGTEHATSHLLYSRFWYLALHDLGVIRTEEPFKRLINQGMLTSYAYRSARGVIIPIDEVEQREDGNYYVTAGSEFYVEEDKDVPVTREYAKMSKSLRNVVNPDDVIRDYGADSFRVFLMSMAPVTDGRIWDTKNIGGTVKLLSRIWDIITGGSETGYAETVAEEAENKEVSKQLNILNAKLAEDIERMKYNTAITALNICINNISALKPFSKKTLEELVLMLSPFAPYMADELWQRLGHEGCTYFEKWPALRENVNMIDETINIAVTLNGKKCLNLDIASDLKDDDVKAAVIQALEEKQGAPLTVIKSIVVRDRKSGMVNIVNIVAKR